MVCIGSIILDRWLVNGQWPMPTRNSNDMNSLTIIIAFLVQGSETRDYFYSTQGSLCRWIANSLTARIFWNVLYFSQPIPPYSLRWEKTTHSLVRWMWRKRRGLNSY